MSFILIPKHGEDLQVNGWNWRPTIALLLRGDLTITSEPKKRSIFTPNSKAEDLNPVEIYSASYEWLVMFRDFCRTSQGFYVS